MNSLIQSRPNERGFTLVELAIVMIIIGLLIGGVLKGQELIANARLTASVTKVKAIDAALNTFQDSYNGKPGDITQAAVRLANCSDKCATNGNGNGRIDTSGPGGAQAAASENLRAWAQLAAVDLLGGIRNTTATDLVEGGVTNPNAEVPGQFFIGYANGIADIDTPTGAAARSGHYLLLHNGVSGLASSAAADETTVSITPNQAARIDQKIDDGNPNTGSVLAMGEVGATGCASASTVAGIYVGANDSVACGVYIRVQQ